MHEPIREIEQQELRHDVGGVLQRVARGERFRLTLGGRPVADLVPVSVAPRFVSRSDVDAIIAEDPLDARFEDDVRIALGGTTVDL